jgi:chemotaxis receptor (MCP) glutamine deamidase CheD
MSDPLQGIRHASLVVAEGDSPPVKRPVKPKGAGQGSAAPTSPPPPVVKDSKPGSKDEIEIREANKKRPRYESFPLTPDNTRGVLQHEYLVVTSGAKQNQLAIYGAGPCVIIALWNRDTKTAGLAHVDDKTNIYSIQAFVEQVASGAKEGTKIQVHLVGGDSLSIDLQATLLKEIKNDSVLELISADLGRSFDYVGGQSLAISATTGKISDSVDTSMIDEGRNAESRLLSVGVGPSYLRRVPEQFFIQPEKRKDPR